MSASIQLLRNMAKVVVHPMLETSMSRETSPAKSRRATGEAGYPRLVFLEIVTLSEL